MSLAWQIYVRVGHRKVGEEKPSSLRRMCGATHTANRTPAVIELPIALTRVLNAILFLIPAPHLLPPILLCGYPYERTLWLDRVPVVSLRSVDLGRS